LKYPIKGGLENTLPVTTVPNPIIAVWLTVLLSIIRGYYFELAVTHHESGFLFVMTP
jgi:hypothetical protein